MQVKLSLPLTQSRALWMISLCVPENVLTFNSNEVLKHSLRFGVIFINVTQNSLDFGKAH